MHKFIIKVTKKQNSLKFTFIYITPLKALYIARWRTCNLRGEKLNNQTACYKLALGDSGTEKLHFNRYV